MGFAPSVKVNLTEQWKKVLRCLCSARLLLHCLQCVSCCSQHCQGSLCLPPGSCRTPRCAQSSRWTRQKHPSTAKGGLCLPQTVFTSEHWNTDKLQKLKPQMFSVTGTASASEQLSPKPPNLSAAHCKQPLVLSTVHLRWLWLLLITGSSKRSLLQKSWGSKILSSQGSKESGDEANLLFQVLKFGSIWNQDPHTWWKPSEYEWTNPDTLK